MKDVKLTELEVAKMKADNESINNMVSQAQQIQGKIQQLQASLHATAQEVLERVDLEDPAPLDQWNFNEVNWDQFAGTVKIPEADEVEKVEPRE